MTKVRTWQPLNIAHRDELISLVTQADNLAARTPSMRRLAVYLIKLAAWRWTADAVDSATGIVVPDAIKYDIRYLPHTADAASVCAQYPKEIGRRLRHEHTVPLKLLAAEVLKRKTSDREVIYEFFNTYCRSAIVTKEEDQRLNSAKLQRAMPSGWRFGEDILARYGMVGIELLPPSSGFA